MHSRLRNVSAGLLLATFVTAFFGRPMPTQAQLPPLIPRDVLFGNPERSNPQLSPNGEKLAWLAPNDQGVMQVWVKNIGDHAGTAVTADKKRGIRQYLWAKNSEIILYAQDKDGDENWHIYAVNLANHETKDLTPFENVQARPVDTDHKFPDDVLIAINKRNPQLHDVYRANVRTGAMELIFENPGNAVRYDADPQLVIRAMQTMLPDGGTQILVRDSEAAEWKPWITAGPEDSLTLSFGGFSEDGKTAFINSAVGRDTAALIEKSIASGTEKIIAASDASDIGGAMFHPTKRTIQAVSFEPGRREWTVIDPSIEADFAGIRKLHDGDFAISSRDTADKTWLVSFTSDRGPVAYYSWNRAAKKGTFQFTHQPKLEGLQLAPMKPVSFAARDGLKINAYLTLPVGVEPKNLPTILFVHGGPWARDEWGFNPQAQWFANRGYACLQVNYRGSTGYGKKFLNAANKQWGLAMHDDLIDAKQWAVSQGFANPDKVAVFGGSYGGYAALAALTFTPTDFACAVDIVGPSNLRTLVQSIPPYWKPMRTVFDNRMGNIDDPKDDELLKNASPLFKADKIVRPLLIGQGANDPRVKQAESEQIVAAIEKSGGKATYVLYPDEGHGFARPQNRIDFNARAEQFLAKHLGGRFEPLNGDRIEGSTAVIREIGK